MDSELKAELERIARIEGVDENKSILGYAFGMYDNFFSDLNNFINMCEDSDTLLEKLGVTATETPLVAKGFVVVILATLMSDEEAIGVKAYVTPFKLILHNILYESKGNNGSTFVGMAYTIYDLVVYKEDKDARSFISATTLAFITMLNEQW